jgi:hypothetical protein
LKVAPNLNFTVIKPEQKSLNDFVQMLKTIYQNFVSVVNGQLGFGDGTNLDNINGSWINTTTPVAPNTDFTVSHNLGRIPSGYWIMTKDRAVDIYTGSVAATATQLTLRATVASAVVRLFIIGLILCLFSTRTAAQGANHTNIALKNTTVAGSTGIGGGSVIQAISGAIITVCTGSTLPTAGATCTGLASIFSNRVLSTTLGNPFNADINGNYTFWASPGPYVVSVAGTGLTTYSYATTLACNPTDSCTFSSAVTFSSTVTGPFPIVAASSNLTAQQANVSTTTLFTPVANGFYRLSVYLVVTQAATTSSTLPQLQVLYTDADTSVAETFIITTQNTGNVVGAANGTASGNPVIGGGLNAKGGVAIQFNTINYASVGATPMQFAVHIRLEGPF